MPFVSIIYFVADSCKTHVPVICRLAHCAGGHPRASTPMCSFRRGGGVLGAQRALDRAVWRVAPRPAKMMAAPWTSVPLTAAPQGRDLSSRVAWLATLPVLPGKASRARACGSLCRSHFSTPRPGDPLAVWAFHNNKINITCYSQR